MLISELKCGVGDDAECSEMCVTQQEIRRMRVSFRMNTTTTFTLTNMLYNLLSTDGIQVDAVTSERP